MSLTRWSEIKFQKYTHTSKQALVTDSLTVGVTATDEI